MQAGATTGGQALKKARLPTMATAMAMAMATPRPMPMPRPVPMPMPMLGPVTTFGKRASPRLPPALKHFLVSPSSSLARPTPSPLNYHPVAHCCSFPPPSPSSFARNCISSSSSSSTASPKKEAQLSVPVNVEESLSLDEDIEGAIEQLELDGPLLLRTALCDLDMIESAETIELSVVLCNDEYIKNLNKEWRGEDSPTDVLSFPQSQLPGFTSLLLLGDVVISVETALRQAEERGHSLLDELRILLLHGLLHVLGYDHEGSPEEAKEMEDQETQILESLSWKGKGLISSSYEDLYENNGGMGVLSEVADLKEGDLRQNFRKARSPFKVLFCDMDGTLLNSKSQMTKRTANALKEAIKNGVQVIIATGKSRPGVISTLQPVGLVGENGAVSVSSPGVFVQGLLVYGRGGAAVHKEILSPDICLEAFRYSLEHRQPLVGFSDDRVVTLFDHPSIEELHTMYNEPKAEVLPSLEHLMKNFKLQKLIFIDTASGIKNRIRPYWSHKIAGRAQPVQAIDYMLEILPHGGSKGRGVRILLDHLQVHPDEAMAIGDGENDIEMLELVGWGVAMKNGSAKTLAVADAQVGSNDEDGVVEALERYVFI